MEWGGAKATITNWSPSDAWGTTWTAGTNTLSWKKDWFNGLYTGFAPKAQNNAEEVDLSMYTKIRYTITSLSGTASDVNGAYIDLKVRSTGKGDQTIKLREGVHDIVFAEYASTIDFSKILELTISATYADGSNKGDPGSAVITEMYLYNPVKTITAASLGDEITSLDYIIGDGESDPQKFVICNGTNAKYFYTNNENENAAIAKVPADAYFYFTLEKYTGNDIPDAITPADNIYKIKITNAAGEGYPRGTSGGYYLNAILTWGGVVISGPEAGWSNEGNEKKDALWYVTYDAEHGFSFQNVYRNEHSASSWLSLETNFNSSQQYLKLYKSLTASVTDLEKEENPANDALFALSDASGYNAETGILKDGGWTFATPVDLSDWDYLIITTEETQREDNTYIRIADDDGKYVEQNGYAPGDQPEMYFSYWNNHNAACISMDYLRKEKDLDISKIKSLTFSGIGLKISSVYLTDYENTKLGPSRGRYSLYVNGDVVREYTASTVGKFGTICLPYVASCAGAEVYSIAGIDGSSISLTKVSGLLEAGKPYFYKASDTVGKRDEDVHNVNFFRADLSKFDAASAGTNNGLIGTFSGISPLEPNDDYYVLSNNTLYQVDAGAVDEKAVSIGANKAYVDISQIVNLGGAVKAFINCIGNDETAIQAIESLSSTPSPVSEGSIFNVAGQRMSKLQKGVNIVNGKKVLVK